MSLGKCVHVAGALGLAVALAVPATAWSREHEERREHEREHDHGRRYAGDFHQHSLYTDGSTRFDLVMAKNNEYGLDWWANSEHGGSFVTDGTGAFWDSTAKPIEGDVTMSNGHRAMWRWQSLRDYVFGDVKAARAAYPDRAVINGLELNVPAHEHCSTAIVGRDASAISAFEYMFDKNDHDLSREGEVTPYGTLTKTNGNLYSVVGGVKKVTGKAQPDRHLDAVAACRWMQAQVDAKNVDAGWMVFAHVERAGAWTAAKGGGYNVEHFRDFNNAGPDVCFGFEGAPGHQVEPYRGLGNAVTCVNGACTSKDFGGTYGGVGFYTAKVGGLWDALLGEGRHFFNFASSDYHQHYTQGGGDFYPGEYQKNWVRLGRHERHGITPRDVAHGLRSGDSFFVQGDLVDDLELTVEQRDDSAHMGETLEARAQRPVQVVIEFSSPAVNHAGVKPVVDHIDLIAGDITGLVPPGDPRYTDPTNPSAQVIASFTAKDWHTGKDGKSRIVATLNGLDRSKYFRLRGTSLPCGTPNQTGPATQLPSQDYCSPLPDALEGVSSDMTVNAAKAFADLWFYSNPVFVQVD